jgi:sulfonate transport system substrate-binding protein
VIVWQSTDVDPRTVVIVVLKDSPLKTLADLKGKTLGVPLWTCGYYGASEALKNAGVPLDTKIAQGEVRYLNVTESGLSITANLLTGKVDAIATHPSGLASLYNQGLVRDIGTAVPGGQFVHDRIVYYTTRRYAQDNPDLIKAFIIAQNKALGWIRDHRVEAAKIVAQAVRKPEDVQQTEFQEAGNQRLFPQEHDYASAVAAFEAFQKLALSNNDGLINGNTRKALSDEQVGALFDKRFFRGGAYYAGDETGAEPKTVAQAGSLK